MLAGGNDLFADLEVQMVGRAIVDHLDFLVGQEIFNAPVGLRDVQFVSFGRGQFIIRLAKRNHLDKAKPSSGLDMCRPNETGSDNACFYGFHIVFTGQTLLSSNIFPFLMPLPIPARRRTWRRPGNQGVLPYPWQLRSQSQTPYG